MTFVFTFFIIIRRRAIIECALVIFSFGTLIIFVKFHSVFQKLDHLTCRPNAIILRINQNEVNGFIHVIEDRHK